MSMKNTKFTGLFTRKKAVRYLIYVLFVCAFAVFVIKLNQVEKTELVVRTGQTFEKAKVVKILQDNLEENGTRVGEQPCIFNADATKSEPCSDIQWKKTDQVVRWIYVDTAGRVISG